MSAEVYSDGYFAVVPEWVLDADVSAQAIRLYAVLRRYADQRTGHAHPSRRTLADRMRVASTRTVDAALDDLVRIGAVEIFTRSRDDGGRSTSGYVVRGVQKLPTVQKMHTPVQQTAQGYAADCAPPAQQAAQGPAQQTAQLEPEPLEPEPLEPEPTNQTPAPAEQARPLRVVDDEDGKLRAKLAQTIAAEHYEATGKLGGQRSFLGLRGIVARALEVGHSEAAVRAALAHLRGRGRSVTNSTLGPLLADPRTMTSDGHRSVTGSNYGPRYQNPDPKLNPHAFDGGF
jgi:Helix-turn-helix domain